MNELQLIKSADFGGVQCDFYGDGKEPWMTREQIGVALEYGDPIRAISKLHARKKERLDKHSAVVKLTTTDGKTYDTTVYNRKGIMEICRHSDQPMADAFMDFCWEVMDSLMSGRAKLVALPKDYAAALRALADETEKSQALQLELDRSKEWYSIKRVANMNGVSFKIFDWRKLKRVSAAMGHEVKKIFDANYGEVNTYHMDVWERVYPNMEL